jgi:5-methylcytosine-specific restriction endonuclease McrA
MKVCTVCKLEKPLTDFSPDKRISSGVQSKCKPCYAEIMRNRRMSDPTKHRAAVKKFRELHYEKVLERNRTYRKNNPEKVFGWKKKDRTVNKARVYADNAKRRSLIYGRLIPEIISTYALRDFYEAMSLGDKFHVDHIVPLSRGGLHEFENLQIISAIDNLRKGVKNAIKS